MIGIHYGECGVHCESIRDTCQGIDSDWNAQRVDFMRWVLCKEREANRAGIDAELAVTGERPIVEVSNRAIDSVK